MLNNKLRRPIRPANALLGKLVPMEPPANDMQDTDAADPILEAFAPDTESDTVALPALLTPAQVAEYLGVGQKTLERWRSTGDGPRYVKLSKSTVRYMPADVAGFVAERLKSNTFQ